MLSIYEKRPKENNHDYAYRAIQEAIMLFELKPGKSINVNEWAHLLRISITFIRAALTKLSEEQYVKVLPQVGTYVLKIKEQFVNEALFMRIALEKEVIKSACESFPEEGLLELKRNLAQQEMLIGKTGVALEFHKLDHAFHSILFRRNQKENVWASITRLSTHYNRVRLLSEMQHNFKNTINQHKKIISIIENKEKTRVEDVINQHLIEPTKILKELYRTKNIYEDYFEFT